MKSPSSEKRHAPSDASSLLESASFSNAIKIVFFATTLVFLFSASPAYAQSGPIIVGDNTVGCTGANAGGIHYVTATNLLEYCNGTAWTAVGSGGSSLWTAGTGNDIYYSTGTYSVGIGLTDPLWPLHVYKSNTTTTDQSEYGIFSQLDISPSADSGGNSSWVRSANRGYAKIPAGNNKTFRKAIGIEGWGENYGTGGGANASLRGVYGWGYNEGNTTINSVIGVKGDAESNVGTVTHLTAADLWAGTYGGNVTNLYGVSIGLDISGGTVTNRYGIKIDDFTGTATNDFGIYQTGGAKNYFADPVGIGTTSPAVKLHVYRSAAENEDTELTVETDGTNKAAYLNLDGTHSQWGGIDMMNAGSSQWFIGNWGGTANALSFYTTSSRTQRMTILSGGNVGIGTASPGTKLTVSTASDSYGVMHTDGTRSIGTWVDSDGGWFGTESNHDLHFFTNDGAPQITLKTSGNVGIGTATPGYKLDVTGPIRSVTSGTAKSIPGGWNGGIIAQDSGYPGFFLVDNSGANKNWNIGLDGSMNLAFGTYTDAGSSSEKMRITSTGNVGIGDANPGATLTVNGSVAITPPSIISLTADNTLVTTAGRSYIRLTSNNTTATNRTFCLDAGTEGQILVLEWTSGTNKGELVDDGTSCASSVAAKLSATWTPAAADATLQLIYRAATPQKWLELSRSAN